MDALKLYVESSNPAQAYYVDEVEITQVSKTPTEPTHGIVSGFEDGTAQGWVSRMGAGPCRFRMPMHEAAHTVC